jgi:hypothetical protein
LVLGIAWLGSSVVGVPLAAFAHQLNYGGVGIFVTIAPFALVGVVLARRVPGNSIGWILLALALAAVFSTDFGFYAVGAYRRGGHGLPLARVAVFFAAWWFWLILLMPLPIALFPNGKLPQRWRWTMPAYIVLCATRARRVLLAGHQGCARTSHPDRRHRRTRDSGQFAEPLDEDCRARLSPGLCRLLSRMGVPPGRRLSTG